MILKQEIYTSLKLTSVKGIPRAVAAKNPILRGLWVIGVFMFLGVCAFQVYLNLSEFFSFPNVMTVEEVKVNYDSRSSFFPTLAVCNINPFSSNLSVYRTLGVPTPMEFFKMVDHKVRCKKNCSVDQEIQYAGIRNILMSPRGYFQHVGMEKMKKLSHQELVLNCRTFMAKGFSANIKDCHEVMDITPYIAPDLGNCMRYQVKQDLELFFGGMSLVLYADNAYDGILNEFRSDYLFQNVGGGGFTFFLYDRKYVPTLKGSLSTTPVGQYTASRIVATKLKRLSPPYSEIPCFTEEDAPTINFAGNTMITDQSYCIGQCVKEAIERDCHCSNNFVLLTTPGMTQLALPQCVSLQQEINDTIALMTCSNKIAEQETVKCGQKCKIPCSEMKYTVKSSTSKWPLSPQIASFYKAFIMNSSIEERFSNYKSTYEAMERDFDNVSPIDRLLATQEIENNFAQIDIGFEDMAYISYEAKPKLSATAFISQLGGALNLWSGISVVVVIEVLDFAVRVCFGQGANKLDGMKNTRTTMPENVSEDLQDIPLAAVLQNLNDQDST